MPRRRNVCAATLFGIFAAMTYAAPTAFAQEPCGWFAVGGVAFFQYLRADGIRVGIGGDESGEFGFEASPRITLGYLSLCGRGLRARYWQYDHFESVEDADEGDGLGIDTYTIDLEFFETVNLAPCLEVEYSVGLRYNEFNETMLDAPGQAGEDIRLHQFSGFGASLGTELQWIMNYALLFARARGVMLQGDTFVFNDDEFGGVRAPLESRTAYGTTQSVVELAVGFEVEHQLSAGSLLFARFAYERQTWFDYTHSIVTDLDFPDIFEQFGAPSNAGFGGFVLTAGIHY